MYLIIIRYVDDLAGLLVVPGIGMAEGRADRGGRMMHDILFPEFFSAILAISICFGAKPFSLQR